MATERTGSIRKTDMSGLLVSMVLHVIVLGSIAMVPMAAQQQDVLMAIETLFKDEDRTKEEFTQELDQQQQIAENLNVVAGGAVTNAIGGSESAQVQQTTKIDDQTIVKDPQIAVNASQITLPGLEVLGDDLGVGQVTGEVGAIVEGYGAALDRFSQELIRMMREEKVLVVWLFDESDSMKDDQAEIKGRFHRIYEELKLADDTKEEVLQTAIVSFGDKVNYLLPKKKPTNDIPTIMKAIDQIPIDKSGNENTCQAIITAINEYRKFATAGKRKMVIMVVSDESGDDGQHVDEALHLAKTTGTPIYFMGREAIFGYLYAHILYVHPETGHHHYLPVRRGPETPFAEQLPIDGFHRRMDASMSGFGPYEQIKLARDTGGVFFMLPNEEQNIIQHDARKYAALDMKEYQPDLSSRRDYAMTRDKSEFRTTIWGVIGLLNPYDPAIKHAEVPTGWVSIKPEESTRDVNSRLTRSMVTFTAMTEAQKRLEAVKGLRDKETSTRWRANYDLILGQIMSYRVRLFQYMIALDQFNKTLPTRKISNPKTTHWGVSLNSKDLLKPDKQQLQFFKVTPEDIESARLAAIEQFKRVQSEHPNTPWAAKAAWELSRPYGPNFSEHIHVPPKPRDPKLPPPAPLPKL